MIVADVKKRYDIANAQTNPYSTISEALSSSILSIIYSMKVDVDYPQENYWAGYRNHPVAAGVAAKATSTISNFQLNWEPTTHLQRHPPHLDVVFKMYPASGRSLQSRK